MDQTIYQFKVKDIKGNIFDFENLRGKKIMIVNTASKCGLTGQYKGLQKLYDVTKTVVLSLLVFQPTISYGTNQEVTKRLLLFVRIIMALLSLL